MSAQHRNILTVDSESFSYIFEENVSVPLGNGGVIRCNVYKPKAASAGTKFPVLVTYGPYGKDVPYKDSEFIATKFSGGRYHNLSICQSASVIIPRTLFKTVSNECFSYEALRAAGYSNYGGADLAEVIAICSKIRPGNEDDWVREWQKAAERAVSHAVKSKSVKNYESAYQGYLRASNYFRTAEFFRRENVEEDSIAQFLYKSSEKSFFEAMGVSSFTYESITIPYEGTTLPGYFVSLDSTMKPRRTIVFNGGYDSTMSEGWFAIGAAALARGYNFLAFDGPGQGAAVRRQSLYFRHDWEHVLTPVIDYALTRTDINANAIAIFGWSMGGYLVARAATQEHRARAIILDDGVYDFGSAFRAQQPAFVQKLVELEYDSTCDWIFGWVQSFSTGIRWGLRNGKWTFGVHSVSEFMRAVKNYTLEGLSQNIVTPCLVLDAENDHFLNGQPEVLCKNLQCEHEFISLRADEGGDTHCHQGAFYRLHQVIFDYLEPRLVSDEES